jgi:hypothetical protein
MAVSANDLVIGPLTPANGVTVISLDFYFEKEEWLEVYKSGSETPLRLTTDYTTSGEGTASGSVTLVVAADGVNTYSVYLVIPLQRSSDMQARGEFKSRPFNLEFDRMWQAMQGLKTRIERSVGLSRASTDNPLVLRTYAANTVLAISADGNFIDTGPTITEVSGANASAIAAAASAVQAELFDGPKFDTTTLASAYTEFTADQTSVVWAGFNGEPEAFKFVSDSTLTADGALVLASAMATGRLVSTRTVFATVAQVASDVRILTVGTELQAAGFPYTVVSSGESFSNAGGSKILAEADERGYNVKAVKAVGDGSADDTAALSATTSISKTFPRGTYNAATIPINANSGILGSGSREVNLARTSTNSMLVGDVDGVTIEGVKLDMDFATHQGGHGVRLTGDFYQIRDVHVLDYGSPSGGGGGTGILLRSGSSFGTLENAYVAPNTSADVDISIGWLIDEGQHNFVGNVKAVGVKKGIGYAHELKNDARFNILCGLFAQDCTVALAYGQTTVGTDGADFNLAMGVVGDGVDVGWICGEGFGNVLNGMVYNNTDAPDASTQLAVHISGDAIKNSAFAVSTHGNPSASVRFEGDSNYVQVAAHDTASNVVVFDAGSVRNVVEIVHPGARDSVESSIDDNSSGTRSGTNANIVHSSSTGERIGSLSGYFHDSLFDSGISFDADHHWRLEDENNSILAFGFGNEAGDKAGINIAATGATSLASFTFTGNAIVANTYWRMEFAGDDKLRFYSTGMRPGDDAVYDLGISGKRFNQGFIKDVRPGDGAALWTTGSGSPESSVTAAIGSMYTRTDGGAGTTLYVKESGTGNTGWVAK